MGLRGDLEAVVKKGIAGKLDQNVSDDVILIKLLYFWILSVVLFFI